MLVLDWLLVSIIESKTHDLPKVASLIVIEPIDLLGIEKRAVSLIHGGIAKPLRRISTKQTASLTSLEQDHEESKD